MIINLNFNLEAWIKNLEMEANSEEEAVQKLMSLSLAEIVEGNTSDFQISKVDSSILEYDLEVQAFDIEYDFDPETLEISVGEYLKNILPKKLQVTIRGVTDSDNLEDLIKDAVFVETGYDAKSLNFEIIKKK